MDLIIVGVALIALGIYVKHMEINFKKNGVKVKTRVILSERVNEYNGRPANGYKTTFEFQLDGENITQTMFTNKKFKEGTIKNGVYLKGKKKNTLSVSGEGFFLAKGGEIVIIAFGVIFILAGLVTGGFIPTKTLLIALGCFIGFIFIGILFGAITKTIKKRKNEVKDLSDDGEPEIKEIISNDEDEEEE